MGGKYVSFGEWVSLKAYLRVYQILDGDFKNEKFIPDSPVPQNLESSTACCPLAIWRLRRDVAAIAIIPDEIGGGHLYEQGWAHLTVCQKMATEKMETIPNTPSRNETIA